MKTKPARRPRKLLPRPFRSKGFRHISSDCGYNYREMRTWTRQLWGFDNKDNATMYLSHDWNEGEGWALQLDAIGAANMVGTPSQLIVHFLTWRLTNEWPQKGQEPER